jgi:hypothetical protein
VDSATNSPLVLFPNAAIMLSCQHFLQRDIPFSFIEGEGKQYLPQDTQTFWGSTDRFGNSILLYDAAQDRSQNLGLSVFFPQNKHFLLQCLRGMV